MWTESHQYELVVKSYQHQLLLPHWYHHPSMVYWLDLASVSDRLFGIFYPLIGKGQGITSGGYTSLVKPGEIIDVVELSPLNLPEIPFDYRFFPLRARVLAMLVSSLGAVWVFLSLRASNLARPALAAALGGSVYLLSWEFGYHARWLAPDLILAQFAALFVFFLAKAERAENPRGWLTSAAVAAGLATATKYTGGGLVPALWLYVLLRSGCFRRALLTTLARHTAVAVGAFLLVTPGALLEPLRFVSDVLVEYRHYSNGNYPLYGVALHDIPSHWLYLVRLWEYFSLAILSPQPAIAAVLAGVSILGLVSSWFDQSLWQRRLDFCLFFTRYSSL